MPERVETMQSTPVINVIQTDRGACDRYSEWMRGAKPLGVHPVKGAILALGQQDYCWTGNVRHWIWERSFEVDLGDRTETWRWRLFASKRGYVLEVEDKYNRPFGTAIRKAGFAALDHFITTWETPCDAA